MTLISVLAAVLTVGEIELPTYPFSDPDPVPCTEERRYPYFRYDGSSASSVTRRWKCVVLENDRIRVTVLPEIGGKIWGALDKESGREFIYFNHAVKFRNIAMRGPWTSGGIEFNFGIIGHSPSTATPVDWCVRTNAANDVSYFCSNVELINRTQWQVEVNLRDGDRFFTTRVLWHNAANLPGPYYQWMTAAYSARGNPEFVFPGMVQIGHEGDAHPWPFDEKGRDLRRYAGNGWGANKSYHVVGGDARSFVCWWPELGFGSFHHNDCGEKYGRKIWLWAQSRAGGIWEDLLTDTDGQYVELQSGRAFNQPRAGTYRTPFKHPTFAAGATDSFEERWGVTCDRKEVAQAWASTNAVVRPSSAPDGFDWNSAYGCFVRAEQAIRERDDATASAALEDALAKEPYFVPALVLKAELAYKRGQYATTRSLCGKALSVNTYDPGANYLDGLAARETGDALTALDRLGLAAYSPLYRSAALAEMTKIYLLRHELEEARRSSRRCLQADGRNPEALRLKALVCRRVREQAEARQAVRDGLSLWPLDQGLRYEAWKSGLLDEKAFDAGVRGELVHETYLELAAWYDRAGCQEDAEILWGKSRSFMGRLRLACRHGDEKELARLSGESVRFVFPFRREDIPSLDWACGLGVSWKFAYLRALLAAANGEAGRADALLEQIDTADDAVFYAYRGKRFGAASDLERAAALDDSWRIGVARMRLAAKTKDWHAVEKVGKAYLAKYPRCNPIEILLAQALVEQGKNAECLRFLEGVTILPSEFGDSATESWHRAQKSLGIPLTWPERLGQGELAADAGERGVFFVAGKTGRAIQDAIDAASAAGGGRVVLRAGEYRSGSLRLRSHVELHLERGAVIVGGKKSDDYCDFPADVCSVRPEGSAKVFLYGWDLEDVSITGEGVIEGQGPEFFDRSKLAFEKAFWGKPPHPRPRMVQLVRCRNVRLEGVTFKDSPGWTMLIRLCSDVTADNIKVIADQRIINSDGIDFDGCRHVRVRNSTFRTGDDCLVVRAMREVGSDSRIVSEDIVFENCDLDSACQTIRMGCPSDDVIRNVCIRNIRGRGRNGINFDYPARYLRSDDEGYMNLSDILVENYTGNFSGSALKIVVEPGVKLRNVSDITVRNLAVVSRQPIRFIGNADSPLKNIVLENARVETPSDIRPWEAVATEPLVFRNCTFNGLREADRAVVTPRGVRQPLVRPVGSWEARREDRQARMIRNGGETFDLGVGCTVDVTSNAGLVFRAGERTLAFDPFVCKPNSKGVRPTVAVRRDGDAVVVDVAGDAADFGSVAPGTGSLSPERLYFGYGYCLQDPDALRAYLGGHANATGFAGFEFTNGLALVMASSSPAYLFNSPEKRSFGFECMQPTTFTFVFGRKGAFDCALRYRERLPVAASPGFAAKAGRFCVDTWNGTFKQHEQLIRACAETYGLKDDLLFYVHCWQRYGFDRHLPDVYPPSPTFGTAEDLKRACATAHGYGWSFGVHLNTIDCYTNSPWFAWNKICHRRNTATGLPEPVKAWFNPPCREQSYRLLPRYGPESIRYQVASLMADDFRPDTVFIDVTGSNAMLSDTCLDSEGKVHSLLENADFARSMFDAARAAIGTNGTWRPFVSSEAPCDFVAGHLDGGDCQWMYLANEVAPYRWLRVASGAVVKTPWFPLVYHDWMSLHGVGYSARFEGARGEDCHGIDSDDYISCEIMNGHSLMADCYNRDAYKAEAGILEDIQMNRCLRQIVRKYWLAQAVARDIATATVVSIEQVEKNLSRLKIVWSSGMTVFVNRGREDWPVATADQRLGTVVLPQYGFVAFNPETQVYAAIRRRGVRVVEESAHREGENVVRYVNPRGHDTAVGRLPLAPQSSVVSTGGVLTVTTKWQVLAGQKRPTGMFKVEYWLLDPMFQEYSPDAAAVLAKTVETTLDTDTVVSFVRPTGARDARNLHVSVAPVGSPDEAPRIGSSRRFKLLGTAAFYKLYRQGLLSSQEDYTPFVCPDDNLWERLFPSSDPVDFGWTSTCEAFRLVTGPDGSSVKTPLPL